MYKILKNIIEMDDYSVQKLSKSQPPEPFQWNTVEGTELNVDDCVGGKGKIGVKANTYQKKLSGKNLWGRFSFTRTMSGVTHQQNADGSIIVNGSTTNAKSYSMMSQDAVTNERIITLQAGDYTLSGASANVKLQFVKRDGTALFSTNSSYSFTLTEETQGFVRTYVMENTAVNNETLYIQLEQGSTATDWEPYCGGQAAPNPSYEIPIKVVTGNNVVKHVGKNLFVGYDNMLNGFLPTANSYPTVNSSYPNARYQILELKAGESITTTIDANYSEGRIRAIDAKTNKIISSIALVENDYYSTTETYAGSFRAGTITAKKDLLIGVMLLKRPTIDLSFQIEYGNTPTPYEPYRGEEYKLDLWKENEFDSENANVLNAYFSEDGKMITSSNKSKTLYIPCKANCTYKITKKLSARFRLLTTNVLPNISVIGDNYIFGDLVNCLKITTGSNAKYLCVFFYNSDYDTLTVQEILDSIQIQEAIELCKIGDYSDILFKNVSGDENYNAELEEGSWYKKEVIRKRDVSSCVFKDTGISKRFYCSDITDYARSNNIPLCNYFKGFENVTLASDIAEMNKIGFNNGFEYNRCYISYDGTLADLTNFLNEHDVVLYYKKNNPAYVKVTDTTLITQLEALHNAKWFKGVNHWWTETDNLEPVLEGTYKQSIQSETQNSIANLQVQANEQNISNTPDLVESEV